ncbi:pyridoxamine 5'-phosphate oxidase family protein [Streptomyces luteolus]|uniref:TIGR03618 family F420-dependent PPOX class oxidoreductase n=1 Tax=Streptomyces luteolus TaxID=3043615 RepID=A0ABT6T764_9ACTN|nr:TIGR03618 family F420-dependent PPOX class oxidoreductase [Streptomyces sp. B-S-A12]MDI3423694.1 TIGR03618 family F420-dependent PPOX class oxidoreductase [Streptomyces sp. B-S-A12]
MSQPHQGTRPAAVSPTVEDFLSTPQIGTLTTLRPDGSPHVTAVRFTWDAGAGTARVLTVDTSRKARNILAAPGSRVALCQAEGFCWVTLEGTAQVSAEPTRVAEGVRRYAKRYFSPPPNPPGRVVLEIAVDRVLSLNC